MTIPSSQELAVMTPMLRQYYDLKARSADAILFFRMGDFFELFGEDAETVAPLLEIVLTSRERGDKEKIKFCGVPHHSAQAYWLKLLKLGFKVAIADQVEEASAAKGLVRRDIIRTMSPACIDELEGLEADCPNYLMAAYEDPTTSQWAVALADVSTGELRLGALSDRRDVCRAIEAFAPKELLVRRFCLTAFSEDLAAYCHQNQLLISPLPESVLRDDEEQAKLWQQHFGRADARTQGTGAVSGGLALVAALLTHFCELQTTTNQFLAIRPLYDPASLALDETVIRDLELFETSRRRQADGSLFKQLNHCLTPMGARLLRHSLANPLLHEEAISRRHAAVAALLELSESGLKQLREALSGVGDIERLSTRVVATSVRPHELARIRASLEKATQIVPHLQQPQQASSAGELFTALRHGLEKAAAPLSLLADALIDEPTGLGEGHGVFRLGYDATLDAKLELSQGGQSRVDAYLAKLRQESGIQSLKVKFHKTFGLVLEVTKSNLARVPESFIRRQTMVNCERFVTIELKELDEALSSAKDLAVAREAELYAAFVSALAAHHEALREVASSFAKLDLLQGFAWLALRHSYCRPTLNRQERFYLKASRHPVVEHYVGRHQFVPNDLLLDTKARQLLITGPNMAGKSTVMRQAAICAILNQAGSFIPATAADMPVFDQIYTRVGAADDLSRGLSTFMVEMAEAAHILRHATRRSLVILDEVGRGTSTQDGLAIAAAILEDLAQNTASWTLFATHYHELVPLSANFASVKIMQTEVQEHKQGIRFTHRLIPGASGSSFGIEVAELAGIPPAVLERAKTYLNKEEGREAALPLASSVRALTPDGPSKAAPAGVLFAQLPEDHHTQVEACEQPAKYEQLLAWTAKLERIKINRTTPLQALNILSDLKSALSASPQRSLFQDRQS